MDTINKNDYLVVGGDFNAQIGQLPIKDILGTNGEMVLNKNRKTLRNFATFNKLTVTNTFFRHKDIHKYTSTSRGYRTIIDYILVNRKLVAQGIDARVYRSYDVSSDHFMLLTKIKLLTRWSHSRRKQQPKIRKQRFKVHLLQENSIRRLYSQRLDLGSQTQIVRGPNG
jgi:hypothetical protein